MSYETSNFLVILTEINTDIYTPRFYHVGGQDSPHSRHINRVVDDLP